MEYFIRLTIISKNNRDHIEFDTKSSIGELRNCIQTHTRIQYSRQKIGIVGDKKFFILNQKNFYQPLHELGISSGDRLYVVEVTNNELLKSSIISKDQWIFNQLTMYTSTRNFDKKFLYECLILAINNSWDHAINRLEILLL
ncbi:hypothetical protein QLL95_gp0629 [Cotonvirus japonicus]|uniref:Ubiquitin-like domain-containing protein n=1 Tax=Cotonvirus japonicus TaxID=2811091 RepID=A0ABM7NTK2_9VIRU|nr:hypothetical protein QLL95_gp0629 [Cotonvirus japonicus]BCS83494.1 hypothetical protein [Cotonvirus japonicus]